MNKKYPVHFESLEELKEYVKKIRPLTEKEENFQRVLLRNPTVLRMMESGADLQSIIVELDRQYNKLLADFIKLSQRQHYPTLCFKDFED